jgi:hypothetical protein
MHRSGMVDLALSGVAETLLIPLYNRAMESQRPDAIMKDEKAVALVTQMIYDFDQVRKIRMFEANKVARIMLTREMDRYARDFLNRHPEAVVVHKGVFSAPLPILGRKRLRLLHGSAGRIVGAQAARPFPRCGAGLRGLDAILRLAG